MNPIQLVPFQCESQPLIQEITANADLWLADKSRQQRIRCQRETQTIFIRSPRKPFPAKVRNQDAREATWTKYAERFPRLRDWLTNFESALSGMLGRVFLVKLTGGSQVYAHDDKGSYYESRDRFHVVLSTSEALQMRCDGLQQELKTGDIAWFDNQREYELENPTNSDAVYLIVDLLPCPPRPRPSSKHKHFELVHAVVPLDDMITELQRGQDLWEWDTSRQERIRVQRETNSIPLRGAMKPTPPGILTRDVHPAIDTAMAPRFPLLYGWVAEFAKSVRGEVSRLAVVRLNPNGTVHEHIDEGEYYLSRDRYHLVLLARMVARCNVVMKNLNFAKVNCGGLTIKPPTWLSIIQMLVECT